jgi:hypothetical protein
MKCLAYNFVRSEAVPLSVLLVDSGVCNKNNVSHQLPQIKGRYSLGQFGSAQLLGRLGLNEI